MKKIILGILVLLVLGYIIKVVVFPPPIAPSKISPTSATINKTSRKMKIISSAFENNQILPTKYTCDGESVIPALQFQDIPEKARSLTLILDDPDAPSGTFVHWIVFNMPVNSGGIGEASPAPPGLPALNSAGQMKYYPACPPNGEHRYFFKLYALDKMLDFKDPEKVDKKAIETQMKGHILDHAELIGRYSRNRK